MSTLLSYLSNVIKRFIQLAQTVIRVQFLKLDIKLALIREFFSWRNSYYEMICGWANIITIFTWFFATEALNTRKLIVSVAPFHRFVARIRSLNGGGGSKFFNITGQPSQQIVPNFAARNSGV